MTTVRKMALALTVAGLMVGMAPSARADSATVLEVGWWSNRPGASAQPAGGYEVANGVQGPQSVAAARVRVDSPNAHVDLVLTEAADQFDQSAALQACPTTATWTAANPGAFDAAPKAACARAVPLTLDSTTHSWSADVTALLAGVAAGKTASLVLVPKPQDAVLGVQTPYQVAFTRAATRGGATAATPSPTPAPSASPAPSPEPAPSGEAVPSFTAPPSFSPAPAPSDFSNPSPSEAPATVPSAPQTPPEPTGQAASGSSFQAQSDSAASRFVAVSAHHGGKPWGRLIVFVPLCALAGVGLAAGRKVAAERGVLSRAA